MAEKTGIPTLRTWHFEASEDIMTKFKLQPLYIIRIKYWNAGGSGNPPSFIPALWNIGILLHKQATLTKQYDGECNFVDPLKPGTLERDGQKLISFTLKILVKLLSVISGSL